MAFQASSQRFEITSESWSDLPEQMLEGIMSSTPTAYVEAPQGSLLLVTTSWEKPVLKC